MATGASLLKRLKAIEATRRTGRPPRLSKGERDARTAEAIADPENRARIFAALPPGDDRRRAAVEAAFRADA